jgi:hypothetical protein
MRNPRWVLEDPALAHAIKTDWLDRSMGDVVGLMVYVDRGDTLLLKTWPHAPVFTDMTEKWMERVGTHAFAYSCLVTMLEGPGWNLTPEPALSWLSRIAGTSVDLSALWEKHDNGQRTAELLQRIYKRRNRLSRPSRSLTTRRKDSDSKAAGKGICHADCYMGLRPTNCDERPRPVTPSGARNPLFFTGKQIPRRSRRPPRNDGAVG